MVNPWFKFYGTEYLSDPKIDQLSASERSCWLTMLCLASVSRVPGTIENLKVFTLLTKSGIYPLEVNDHDHEDAYTENLGVIEHFIALQMIEVIGVFAYKVLNWEKRQETALTNAERQARYRESNEKVTGRVTKVTLEKKRKEKKRKETNTLGASTHPITNEKEIDMKKIETPGEFAKRFFDEDPDALKSLLDAVLRKTNGKGEPFIAQEMPAFASYWTEPNKSGTKVRWQLQSTFDVYRRFYTWLKRAAERTRKGAGSGITV